MELPPDGSMDSDGLHTMVHRGSMMEHEIHDMIHSPSLVTCQQQVS